MKLLLAIVAVFAALSCEKVKETATGAVNTGAQAVGRTASDVVNNIDRGISESLSIDIQFSDELKRAGLTSGKYYTNTDASGNENIISIYLISSADIDRALFAKLYDKKGLEMGRTKVRVKQAKGDAGYHDFIFDPKIRFEYQSKLIIE